MFELGLLALAVVHVLTGLTLFYQNWRARPVKYCVNKWAGGRTIGSATMPYTGLLLLAFVTFHLINFHFVDKADRTIFEIVASAFAQPWYVGIYVLAMIAGGHPRESRVLERLPDRGRQPSQVHAPPSHAGDPVQPARRDRLRCDSDLCIHRRRLRTVGTIERKPPMKLDAKIPSGPLAEKWDRHRFELKLVNPANKRKYDVIVVGTGLAGASASASLAELGYDVKTFCIQDSPRRAHSIAAQGGINAAKNYANDGDSIWRLFYDTVKGGDFRAREANVYRLAQVSAAIIDQGVAQGIPFARDYGGLLANRSFGGAQVSRTFYARGQTGQQLLLGAYSSMMRQVGTGKVKMVPRREMLDLVLVNGQARGIVVRNLVTGEIETHSANAVVLCTGGYGNVYFLSTNAMASNVTACYRAYKKGALFSNPCFTQIHPTCIPVHGDYQSKLTLMSESLRNDGRVWVPKNPGDKRPPKEIPEAERDYYLENKYPSFGNLVPRDVASRNAKEQCDMGKGVGDTALAVYLDFEDAIQRDGKDVGRPEVRQPLSDVREDHGRESLRNADDDLPCRTLHHGRPVGGLQPDEHDPGAVRSG